MSKKNKIENSAGLTEDEIDDLIGEDNKGGKKKKDDDKPAKKFLHCTHKGLVEVFKGLYAGSLWSTEATLAAGFRPALVVSLTGSRLTPAVTMNRGATAMLSKRNYKAIYAASIPIAGLVVDWSDGSIPAVSLPFWKDLANFHRKGNSLLFHCQAGHGRTGTALVAFMHAVGYTGDLVEYIRTAYCQKSVETQSQITYLKHLGVQTNAEPSDPPTNYKYSTSGYTYSAMHGWSQGD